MNLGEYSSLVFDCDGVVLNSNHLKTEAFYTTVARGYGEAAAEALVKHHVDHGGISRNLKFAYFLKHIVPKHAPKRTSEPSSPELERLLGAFARTVRMGLMGCEVAEGLESLRVATSRANWCIVSGGAENELREVFAARGLDTLFDAGIFGSPDDKKAILAREIERCNIRFPALLLGDSRYDFEVAGHVGIDFMFVSDWTEVEEWETFVKENGLDMIGRVSDL